MARKSSAPARRARPRGPIVLLTDFGAGPFQGVMKGVILARTPAAAIVDLDHHVRPGGIAEGAYVLESAVPWFPATSIFCCVVDPGVGTTRRRIVVEVPRGPLGVGPDNGILTPLVSAPGAIVRELANDAWFADDDTKTFEGRSRFAPASAALAAGAAPKDAGKVVRDPVVLELAGCRPTPAGLEGRVVYVDSFGNLVTSVRREDLDRTFARDGIMVGIGTRAAIPLRDTYGDAGDGELVAYVGSTGRVEVAVRGGSAAQQLGAGAGAKAVVGPAKRRAR